MVLVNGIPILHHHLSWLRAQGITRAVLLTGYLHEVIDAYFAEPRIDGLQVDCVVEEHPLGRGGALRHGFEQAAITDDLVVATNGDVLTDQPLAPMIELHHSSGASVTALLTPMVSPYGVVDVNANGRVTGFREKIALPHWINAGVYLLTGALLRAFPVQGDHETSTFPELAQAGLMAGYRSQAFWRSVESPKDVSDASDYLSAHPSLGGG
jgi:NDP-sugar pyrophosphorylase family protein